MQNLSGTMPPAFDYMIIDFGALGLQASVFHYEKSNALRCLSHAYTRELSGDVIDTILFECFRPCVQAEWTKAKNTSSIPLHNPQNEDRFVQSSLRSLLRTVQQMKTQTSTAADIVGTVTLVPFDADIEVKMTAPEFDSLLRREMEGWIQNILSNAIEKATQKSGTLNLRYVRWTGRSSLLPLFQTLVKSFFNKQGLFFLLYLTYSLIFFVLSRFYLYISCHSHFYKLIYSLCVLL